MYIQFSNISNTLLRLIPDCKVSPVTHVLPLKTYDNGATHAVCVDLQHSCHVIVYNAKHDNFELTTIVHGDGGAMCVTKGAYDSYEAIIGAIVISYTNK